jgi:hypothetical protein
MPSPRKGSITTKHKCYVVRGGEEEGIYNVWSDAINANYKKKQRYGDAIKIEADTIEEMNFEANKFLETAPSNEKAKKDEKKVDEGSYMLKLILFYIFVMIVPLIILYLLKNGTRGNYQRAGCEMEKPWERSDICLFADTKLQIVDNVHGLHLNAFTAQLVALIVYALLDQKKVDGLPYMLKSILFWIFVMVNVFIVLLPLTALLSGSEISTQYQKLGCNDPYIWDTLKCKLLGDILQIFAYYRRFLPIAFTVQFVVLTVFVGFTTMMKIIYRIFKGIVLAYCIFVVFMYIAYNIREQSN